MNRKAYYWNLKDHYPKYERTYKGCDYTFNLKDLTTMCVYIRVCSK